MRSIFLDQHDSSKSASCLRVAYLAPASLEGRNEVTNAEAAAQPLYHKALAHLDDGELLGPTGVSEHFHEGLDLLVANFAGTDRAHELIDDRERVTAVYAPAHGSGTLHDPRSAQTTEGCGQHCVKALTNKLTRSRAREFANSSSCKQGPFC